MAYITREDGEHFVIPSYREVLSAKQKSVLKKDVLLLSQSYGEYITLQKKNQMQYEIAFSPDTGYLLGESIWSYFKKPIDLIYCEAIPGTTEAILVIVKDGSVYLDGSFPLESIPEELVVFLTQENHFEIYTYGDVPISQTQEAHKFNFEASVVKSFTVLEKPIFATLPLLKAYRLQLVDVVLKAHGIGVFPIKPFVGVLVVVGLGWMLWSYMTSAPQEIALPVEEAPNPYLAYNQMLASATPDEEMKQIVSKLQVLYTMPGWIIKSINYAGGNLKAKVMSKGSSSAALIAWTKEVGATFDVEPTGIVVNMSIKAPVRPIPTKIYPVKNIISVLLDKIATVYPGNSLQLGELAKKGAFIDAAVTINVSNSSIIAIGLIGQQLKDLPVVLKSVALAMQDNGELTGSINIDVLGN